MVDIHEVTGSRPVLDTKLSADMVVIPVFTVLGPYVVGKGRVGIASGKSLQTSFGGLAQLGERLPCT